MGVRYYQNLLPYLNRKGQLLRLFNQTSPGICPPLQLRICPKSRIQFGYILIFLQQFMTSLLFPLIFQYYSINEMRQFQLP
jgi:hypothetical protein